MDAFLAIAVVLLVVWLWLDGTRSREFTIRYCVSFCQQNKVQLLDQSIHMKKLFPVRKRGRLVLRRFYAFEFSINGTDRYSGVAVECQDKIEYLSLLHPEGVIIQGRAVAGSAGIPRIRD